MKYRKLGRTGLKVSHLCLGTMTFGNKQWGCDETMAHAIIDRFLGDGGNFIDTADVYNDGVAEQITGHAIKEKRHQVILATKVAGPMGPGINDLGLSRKHIMDSIDASLQRLGTDYVDLYQVHAYDPTTPLDETLRALDDCVRAGKVRYIGCSNYSAWQLMKANGLAREMGTARFDCLQPQYSLICRYIEREHLPLCLEEGIGVIPWSPLGGGMLTGKIKPDEKAPQGSRAAGDINNPRYSSKHNLAVVAALLEAADALKVLPAQLALAWCMNQPGVTSPIFGARTMEQLESNLAAADLELNADDLGNLLDVSAPALIYPYDFHVQVKTIMEQFGLD